MNTSNQPLMFDFLEGSRKAPFEIPRFTYCSNHDLHISPETNKGVFDAMLILDNTGACVPSRHFPVSRSHNDDLKRMLLTETQTFSDSESPDSDEDRQGLYSAMMCATSTLTEDNTETSDADNNAADTFSVFSTIALATDTGTRSANEADENDRPEHWLASAMSTQTSTKRLEETSDPDPIEWF